jgi:hypothetical protein
MSDEQGAQPMEPDQSTEGPRAETEPNIPAMPPMQPPVVYVQQGTQTNGLAVASLVLGILGVVLFWTVWGGVILGVLAIVFGAVGRGRANRGAPNKGMATAGLVLGIVGLVGSILFVILVVNAVNNTQTKFSDITYCINNPNAAGC